jgi:hypothetical protein
MATMLGRAYCSAGSTYAFETPRSETQYLAAATSILWTLWTRATPASLEKLRSLVRELYALSERHGNGVEYRSKKWNRKLWDGVLQCYPALQDRERLVNEFLDIIRIFYGETHPIHWCAMRSYGNLLADKHDYDAAGKVMADCLFPVCFVIHDVSQFENTCTLL